MVFEWDIIWFDFIEIFNFNLFGLIFEDFNLEGEFIGEGWVIFVWFNMDFIGLDLIDGIVIFDFCFEVIGDDGYGGF